MIQVRNSVSYHSCNEPCLQWCSRSRMSSALRGSWKPRILGCRTSSFHSDSAAGYARGCTSHTTPYLSTYHVYFGHSTSYLHWLRMGKKSYQVSVLYGLHVAEYKRAFDVFQTHRITRTALTRGQLVLIVDLSHEVTRSPIVLKKNIILLWRDSRTGSDLLMQGVRRMQDRSHHRLRFRRFGSEQVSPVFRSMSTCCKCRWIFKL